MLTINDVKDRMKHLDEITILEILDITSEELVENFTDKIEDRYEELSEELSDEDFD